MRDLLGIDAKRDGLVLMRAFDENHFIKYLNISIDKHNHDFLRFLNKSMAFIRKYSA